MKLAYAVLLLLGSALFAYCYFSRNKAIADSGRFWRGLTFMFLCLSINFTLRHFELHNPWYHSVIFSVFGYYLHDTFKSSYKNIKSSWATMKSKEQVDEITATLQAENQRLKEKVNQELIKANVSAHVKEMITVAITE
ncbi:hypothetical protein [Nonlabens agnitus]|uniref:Uncharacterized protein n=1 Tax=Nonlabens agnitus TaxID=870484 RepID=A0A2S9WX96_9FLAO|nr:hypothetical protein [Nonlabens agnitus]PRP68100.1 hypothetical protein BST86_13895 [Nonlabens agnitus]